MELPDKVHYGCGSNVLQGWLNVDCFDSCFPWETVPPEVRSKIVPLDLVGRHPHADNHFRFGFSEHLLEHLDQAESLVFLSECFRTFSRGGVLRLAFPGLRGVLRRHYRSSDFDGALLGRHEAYTMWSHKHFYCEESLSLVATHIGFSRATVVPTSVSEHPELRNLELRNKPEQSAFNLVMELTK